MTRRWWTVFAACVVLLAGVLGWITKLALDLEHEQRDARARADHQELLRLALWRMDSWLAPRLAQEAARPYFEYQPYYAPDRVYDEMLQPLEGTNLPLTPSPLLVPASDVFPLHFQFERGSPMTSPQVPDGDQLDLAFQTCTNESVVGESRANLLSLRAHIAFDELDALLVGAERRADLLEDALDVGPAQTAAAPDVVGPRQRASDGPPLADLDGRDAVDEPSDVYSNRVELQKRAQTSKVAREAAGNWNVQQVLVPEPELARAGDARATPAVSVGPLLPVWTQATRSEGTLMFARRVHIGPRVLLQGFVANWDVLRASLLAEVDDLLDDADLLPLRPWLPEGDAASDAGLVLATLPAYLLAPSPAGAAASMTPLLWSLVLVWGAGLLAVGAVGTTLRASIVLGERRSRFASAVTHELRTPLTTFRLYAEMLAGGMVTDAQVRQEYLETLESESERLARLVENVLAYSRLEQGRAPVEREEIGLGDLLARVVPTLERRARDAGLGLAVEVEDGRRVVETDATVVGQILFNLVDNAAKYAAGSTPPEVALRVTTSGGRARFDVIDHGPGVPPDATRRVFDAFERRGPANVPGVGLGLALSRGLARELGGELELVRDGAPGARFRLTL